MKVKSVVVRNYLETSKLRQVCVDNDYYTRGDNYAYDKMFRKLWDVDNPKELTNEKLIDIAQDIFDHSNIERIMRDYGCGEEEVLNSIMFNLVNACYQLVEVEYE